MKVTSPTQLLDAIDMIRVNKILGRESIQMSQVTPPHYVEPGRGTNAEIERAPTTQQIHRAEHPGAMNGGAEVMSKTLPAKTDTLSELSLAATSGSIEPESPPLKKDASSIISRRGKTGRFYRYRCLGSERSNIQTQHHPRRARNLLFVSHASRFPSASQRTWSEHCGRWSRIWLWK